MYMFESMSFVQLNIIFLKSYLNHYNKPKAAIKRDIPYSISLLISKMKGI